MSGRLNTRLARLEEQNGGGPSRVYVIDGPVGEEAARIDEFRQAHPEVRSSDLIVYCRRFSRADRTDDPAMP